MHKSWLSLDVLCERLVKLQNQCSSTVVQNQPRDTWSHIAVKMISHDSRSVTADGLYVALSGRNTHGARFIPQALAQGAVAIALPIDTPTSYLEALYTHSTQGSQELKIPVLWLSAQHQRFEMAYLAEWVYGSPISLKSDTQNQAKQTLDLIGITGTNGKTTTSTLLADILDLADGDTGLIGTIETRGGGIQRQSKMTTMEATDLHAHYRKLLNSGVKRCVMEVSSIGIEESRVSASLYQRAAFLNLSEDHLDYHKDMKAYAQAKLRLFSELLAPNALSIICMDGTKDSQLLAQRIIDTLQQKTQSYWRYTSQPWTVTCQPKAEVYWKKLQLSPQGLSGFLHTPKGELEVRSSLMGRFNADNIAVACALALSLDISISHIQKAIAHAHIKGRMERVSLKSHELDSNRLPEIRVDYAHTPDALERAITALKAHCTGRLWVLFGCGGDRDAQKRPLMGASCFHADGIVLSSDNPRDEDPHIIMAQVVPGLIQSGKKETKTGPQIDHYWLESDRALAIYRLIACAEKDDLILIAGKGHEPYQEVQDGLKLDFSDQEHALQALQWKNNDMMNEVNSLSTEQLCIDIGGQLIFGQHHILSEAVIDTRKLAQAKAGAFFCLQGQRDGHEFIEDALSQGAKAIVVRRDWQAPPKLKEKLEKGKWAVIAVSCPQKALSLWACAHRQRVFKGIMIGLTGSNGKTSTKELLASALSELGNCLATEGNYNNHLGVPLTLLRLRPEHRFAVLEMGMNAPGEIAELTRWVKPDLSLITTISSAHLEGLGSIEAIAAAKGEIISESFPNPVIMPLAIPLYLRQIAQADTLQKSQDQNQDLSISLLSHSNESLTNQDQNLSKHERLLKDELFLIEPQYSLKGSQAQVIYQEQSFKLELNILGRHQLENARLALAAGLSAYQLAQAKHSEKTPDERYEQSEVFTMLLKGLAKCKPAPLRGEVLSYPRPLKPSSDTDLTTESKPGLMLLDCYNANPQSILASVHSFIQSGSLTEADKTLFVIGQVGELGESSADLHQQLGQDLSEYLSQASYLFTFGQFARFVAEGYRRQLDLPAAKLDQHIQHFDLNELEQLIQSIQELNPTYIFVKGSRSVRLERLLVPLGIVRSSSVV